MGECAPNDRLFSVALHQTNVAVGESAELFDHGGVTVGIFVRSDVHAFAAEDGIRSFQIFFEKPIEEGVGLGIEEVKVVHAVVLASDFGLIVGEGKGVGGHVNLRNDGHAILLSQFLQVDELLLGVGAVFCGESGIGFRFQAEGSLRLVPVIAEELAEAVVVEVNLKRVHLVVGKHLRQFLQICQRNELAAAVNHESAKPIFRYVGRSATGNAPVFCLFGELEQRAGSPERALFGGGGNEDGGCGVEFVAFISQSRVFLQFQNDVAGFHTSLRHCQGGAKHLLIVCGEDLSHALEFGTLDHDATGRNDFSLGTRPGLQFGNYERFRINLGMKHGRKSHGQHHTRKESL